MTIGEFLLRKETKNAAERLQKLIDMYAPEVYLNLARQDLADLKKGELNIGGDRELLKLEFEDYKVMKGSNQKLYIIFDNKVKYFPQAKFGRYITSFKA